MDQIWTLIINDISSFSWTKAFSATMLLFVSVDIVGAIPIVLSLRDKGSIIKPKKVSIWSLVMLLVFLFVGQPMLGIFGVDINSFAVAGSIVLFVLAVEMLFGVQVFKDDSSGAGDANIVPLVFPLFAGAASFTALLTMRSSGVAYINLVFAIVVNTVAIFAMLRMATPLEKWLGKGGIFVLRKFFGVILLALSIKFFIDNLLKTIETLQEAIGSGGGI